jgi:hypothetical protein
MEKAVADRPLGPYSKALLTVCEVKNKANTAVVCRTLHDIIVEYDGLSGACRVHVWYMYGTCMVRRVGVSQSSN